MFLGQLIANKTMWEYSLGLQIINNKRMCYDYRTVIMHDD